MDRLQTHGPTISSLPTELLCRIFEIGHSESSFQSIEHVLSQVDMRWRHIVLSMPGLWAKISYKTNGTFGKLTAYIARSKGHALDLRLDLAGNAQIDFLARNLILLHTSRIRRLHVISRLVRSMENGFVSLLGQ